MDAAIYKAFVKEVKLASIRERMTQAAQGVVSEASDKVRELAGRVAEPVTEGAKKQVGELAAEGARALEAQAKPIGQAMGAGIAEHAPAVGRAMGEGIGEHLSDVGGRALTSAVDKIKEYGKSPYVRGTGAALGTLYAGSKIYGAHKQHQRDKRMERMTTALEALASKGTDHV
jgi:hypothetical protein